MIKSNKTAVRSHSQEREWLVNLGKGNIVAGVRSLVQQTQGQPPASNGSWKSKTAKLKK